MVIGEIIGILFLIGVIALFAVYIYCTNRCPECGTFRSVKRVQAKYTKIDNEIDGWDVIQYLASTGEHRSKGSIVKWVDRCHKCGYESRGEYRFRHY